MTQQTSYEHVDNTTFCEIMSYEHNKINLPCTTTTLCYEHFCTQHLELLARQREVIMALTQHITWVMSDNICVITEFQVSTPPPPNSSTVWPLSFALWALPTA